jgi:3-phosphoglycerate kinase
MNFLLKQKEKEIIIGGGDLVSCISESKLKAISYKPKANIFISTGGGATLEFLAKGTLPRIKALK